MKQISIRGFSWTKALLDIDFLLKGLLLAYFRILLGKFRPFS